MKKFFDVFFYEKFMDQNCEDFIEVLMDGRLKVHFFLKATGENCNCKLIFAKLIFMKIRFQMLKFNILKSFKNKLQTA